jgi:hypothetical protein
MKKSIAPDNRAEEKLLLAGAVHRHHTPLARAVCIAAAAFHAALAFSLAAFTVRDR